MIGDLLYGLTEKEGVSAPVLQRHTEGNASSVAATAIVIATAAVPVGIAWNVRHLYVRAAPGAAQTVVDVFTRQYANDGLDEIIGIVTSEMYAGIGNNRWWHGEVDLWLLQDELLVATANFSASAAANRLELQCFGWRVPVGTLQRNK